MQGRQMSGEMLSLNSGLVSLPFVTSQSVDFQAVFDILRALCDGNKVTEVSEIIGKKTFVK